MTLASRGRAVTVVALLLLAGVYVRALVFTPLERFQGAAQKIFYLHVPAAWSAMLAMGLVGLASVLYLILKDPRFDLTLFLFFLYIGYLLLRQAVPDPGVRARYSAVLGICGTVLLPFIHLSVYLFRTLHPQPIVLKPSAPSLPGVMLVTLLYSFGVFTLLYIGFVMQRYAVVEEGAHA